MTIRRRLFWSNILMLVVPAVTTALVGLLCLGMLWLVMMGRGAGFGVEDSGDFYWVGQAASDAVGSALEAGDGAWERQLDQLTTLLDANSMCLVVTDGDQVLYSYGQPLEIDDALCQAAEGLGLDPVLVGTGERGVYFSQVQAGGRTVSLSLFGTPGEHIGRDLRPAAALAALLILCVIAGSILLTNRFLTRFVLRKIEGPLDLLAAGTQRIGQGDLDFRISYAGRDEFAPVCDAFNEMAARLKASVERIRRDDESRKELLAGISHDLRSPLTSIRAYVEGLLDGVPQTERDRQRYLCIIRSKAEDIDRLVSQLFLYAKLDLEGVPTQNVSLRLDRFVTDFLREDQTDHREQGLEVSADRLAPVTVCADPEQLRRVLTNILDNSAKYKAHDHGHVCITLCPDGCLTLTDDGPGVPEAALPRLFDAFYRSDPARKDPAGGSGLGLAIAAKAVQNMGGTIRAYAPLQGGLAIEITLPREADQDAEYLDRRG